MKTKRTADSIPQCFISYSWDSDSHKEWVRNLAEKLQENGVAMILDQWETHPGLDLPSFMESSIRNSQFVLLVCTPNFCKKANERPGGVGYEGAIVTGELFSKKPSTKKFIPILREGDHSIALPSYLKSRIYLDFRDSANQESSFEELLRHIYNMPRFKKPPLGKRPLLEAKSSGGSRKSKRNVQSKSLMPARFHDNVFLNVPFDSDYRDLFRAQVFTVFDCGFVPRTIMEDARSDAPRINKIFALIASSKYAIHDITPYIDSVSTLPRFNMPFELGMFLAVQRFESDRKKRYSLIIEKEKYHYQRYFSDIAGTDIQCHDNDPQKIIRIVRNWLSLVSNRSVIPSATTIQKRYKMFGEALPEICSELGIKEGELTFVEFSNLVLQWGATKRIKI